MRSKRDWAHLIIVKNYHVYASRTGKVPNINDVISYIMTSSPWRSLFAWRVIFVFPNRPRQWKAATSSKAISAYVLLFKLSLLFFTFSTFCLRDQYTVNCLFIHKHFFCEIDRFAKNKMPWLEYVCFKMSGICIETVISRILKSANQYLGLVLGMWIFNAANTVYIIITK